MHAWQKFGFKVSKLATVYVKGFLWFALSQIQQYFMKYKGNSLFTLQLENHLSPLKTLLRRVCFSKGTFSYKNQVHHHQETLKTWLLLQYKYLIYNTLTIKILFSVPFRVFLRCASKDWKHDSDGHGREKLIEEIIRTGDAYPCCYAFFTLSILNILNIPYIELNKENGTS